MKELFYFSFGILGKIKNSPKESLNNSN